MSNRNLNIKGISEERACAWSRFQIPVWLSMWNPNRPFIYQPRIGEPQLQYGQDWMQNIKVTPCFSPTRIQGTPAVRTPGLTIERDFSESITVANAQRLFRSSSTRSSAIHQPHDVLIETLRQSVKSIQSCARVKTKASWIWYINCLIVRHSRLNSNQVSSKKVRI